MPAAPKKRIKVVGKPVSSVPRDAAPKGASPAADRDYGISQQIIWDLVSISNHLEEMRRCWARLFGLSGPQWLILMAIDDLDLGSGVSVNDVSTKVHAVSTFVTKQTKMLEKHGLVSRVGSSSDARVVLMSLTEEARERIAKVSAQWDALHTFMFSDFDASAWRDVKHKLELLKKRSKIAAQRVNEEL
jgi:DNA-binding MarR family transcriptional regulator